MNLFFAISVVSTTVVAIPISVAVPTCLLQIYIYRYVYIIDRCGHDMQNYPHSHVQHENHRHRYPNSSLVHDWEVVPERGRNCETFAQSI